MPSWIYNYWPGMQVLIRYLLLCSFLAFGGYSYPHAQMAGDVSAFNLKSTQSGTAKSPDRLKATEVDDDDTDASKKIQEIGKGFTTYEELSLSYFKYHYSNNLPYSKFDFYSSTPKYILYRVLRT